MKRRKKRTIITIFFTFTALLLVLVLVLFYLALRQGVRYNRVLSEYEASSLSSRLTDRYLSGEDVSPADLGSGVAGFGVYDEAGTPMLRLGSAPAALTDIHPGHAGDAIYRDGSTIFVVRTSGRGRQAGRSSVPGPRDRISTLLIYDDSRVRGSISLMVLLTGFLFILFIALIVGIIFLYRRLNRIRAEEGKNQQLIRLGQAARVLTHEIKNPLGSIRIQEKILAKKLPPEYKPALSVIGEETARIARLTDRVGDFLKHPEGEPRKTDLVAAVRNITEHSPGRVTMKNRTDGPAFVFIDPDNLNSVLGNIVGNALECTGTEEDESVQPGTEEENPVRPGTEEDVLVLLERTKGGFTVKVADSGPGIDPASADRIFDLFYTTRTTGSGIGLAVAKSFIEAAGGTISAANGSEGGAEFTVFLPEYRSP